MDFFFVLIWLSAGCNNRGLHTFHINFHHKWDGGSPLHYLLSRKWAGRAATIQNIAPRFSSEKWCFPYPEVTYITFDHSSLTEASHMTTSNVKGAGHVNLHVSEQKTDLFMGQY